MGFHVRFRIFQGVSKELRRPHSCSRPRGFRLSEEVSGAFQEISNGVLRSSKVFKWL